MYYRVSNGGTDYLKPLVNTTIFTITDYLAPNSNVKNDYMFLPVDGYSYITLYFYNPSTSILTFTITAVTDTGISLTSNSKTNIRGAKYIKCNISVLGGSTQIGYQSPYVKLVLAER